MFSLFQFVFGVKGDGYYKQQEGFLRCQTPTATVRLKVEGCRAKNGGCRIKSEE